MYKIFIIVFALTTGVLPIKYSILDQDYYEIDDVGNIFEVFVDKYGKTYHHDEYIYRLNVFKENLKKINDWNIENPGAFGINEFSDLTYEEFSEKYKGFKGNYSGEAIELPQNDALRNGIPDHLDWREYNIVTPVKNQYTCGSCYVFSAIANIESQYAMKHQALKILSEQQALDCDYMSEGCAGGEIHQVFDTLAVQGGSMKEGDYPYVNFKKRSCDTDKSKIVVRVKGTKLVGTLSEESLKAALYLYGPLSIGIATTPNMPFISNRKIFEPIDCPLELDHAVLLIGYGQENGEDYWIIKNSWGTDWADRGFVRMKRGVGLCGIGTYVALADVE